MLVYLRGGSKDSFSRLLGGQKFMFDLALRQRCLVGWGRGGVRV